ncbi:hypothetical protein D9757_007444 [Collybiopsis confluens]|uniref:MYND-type domain-containing protein n=1 Tax=Collybiopsis confluens TaxID=2823264 RepID=A0A8H5M8D7_9AGAR|nr:hypothetical protein D9757_007444 [Collybiopsis confluens]
MALVSNPRHSLPQRGPVVPAFGRVKSLVRTSSVMRRLRRRKSSGALSLNGTSEHAVEAPRIETFVSTAIGSGLLDDPITHLICANQSTRPLLMGRCSEQGIVSCPRCQLVKYCSERCQKQHWTRHRTTCAHPYLEDTWQPGWVLQDRPPSFACASTSFSPSLFISPVFDVLREQTLDCDFKLCFPACIDIRNLIETVNNLPLGYRGRFDVLLNTSDPITANRNLVILYALLHPLDPEPSTDKVAALAVHLMYSSALTSPGAAYLKRCLDDIYGSQYEGDNFSFRISLGIRGKGKIHSLQTITGTKQPREMFNSTYGLAQALRSQRRVLDAPENTDHWDRFLSRLKPSHRMAFKRFRDTGVLAPFSADTSHFTHPNRYSRFSSFHVTKSYLMPYKNSSLMFSAKGEWLGRADFNPFQGWDATAVQESGHRIASINSADIFSCLFFHLKSEFQRFISQVENLNLNFVLTQYDPHILSKGISAGIVPIFEGACFDRIDTRDMMDDIGINSCLADWGPC